MLWLIFFLVLVLWFLGFITSTTLGGWLHILLLVAIIVLIVQLVAGRRAV